MITKQELKAKFQKKMQDQLKADNEQLTNNDYKDIDESVNKVVETLFTAFDANNDSVLRIEEIKEAYMLEYKNHVEMIEDTKNLIID